MKYPDLVKTDLIQFGKLSKETFFQYAKKYANDLINIVNHNGYDGEEVAVQLAYYLLNIEDSITDDHERFIQCVIGSNYTNSSFKNYLHSSKIRNVSRYELKNIFESCDLVNGTGGPLYMLMICLLIANGKTSMEELDILEYFCDC